ncbi:MAG TPA: site-2 protease family protein [Thermoanaerobaculia bacterium]|nr:site-2 protease family protein [Thermoanaerobaculia bacterium]
MATERERTERRAEAEEAGSPWAFRIGTALGIPIRIHFTFLLLLVWFGVRSTRMGETFLSGVGFILLLFGCVLLHELGHAAMARVYEVKTREIVLYPIGGIARLERMPSGKAELLIALAGPAVNLVLAGMLFAVWAAAPGGDRPGLAELAAGNSVLLQLLAVNASLFFFNLLPAFPMDGGRVLRATLTFVMSEERATAVAAAVGQGAAIVFGGLGLITGNFILVFIAFFVFLGAGQEAAFHRSRAAVQGLDARAARITRFDALAPQDSLGKAAELLLTTHQHDFPVVDAWGRVAGLLHRGVLLEALARAGRDTPVLEVMEREVAVVAPGAPLEEVLRVLQGRPSMPLLVVDEGRLAGMITLENLTELIEVSRRLRPVPPGAA